MINMLVHVTTSDGAWNVSIPKSGSGMDTCPADNGELLCNSI